MKVPVLICLLLTSLHAPAATLLVGPLGAPRSLAEAVTQAQDGDVIELLPGDYRGDVAVILQKKLTLKGIGKRPTLHAAGKSAEGKAILVIRDGEVDIDNIEFRGTRVADNNGAGIRFEKGKLHLRRSSFVDNENGLLTANDESSELTIEDCEFSQVPNARGTLPHLLYVGRLARLEVTGSRFHQGFEGHLIKSRAKSTRIAYNLIFDGVGGAASYEIDLPNGGDAVVIGNIIGQSRDTQNPVLISYGAEGRYWAKNRLLLSHNTLISDAPFAWYLRAWIDKLVPGAHVRAVNNLTVGLGVFTLGSSGRFDGNWPALRSMLDDPAMLAFELRPDTSLRGRVDPPRDLAGDEAVPTAEFVLPIGTRPLAPPANWSPGALQR